MSPELKTPTLSKQAAKDFANKWRSAENEIRDYQSFWEDFFRHLCGVDDTKVAGIEFQFPVKSATSGNQNWIDVYWKNVAIIEHKSKGEDLDKAELQARGYLRSLAPGYRPRTLIISDFANFRIIDVKLNRTHEFKLDDLPENIHRFEHIISGSKPHALEEEITVDQEAAKLMANLYLELESNGYEGHETSVFLVRILFLFFGDDTKMWEHNIVKKLLLNTKEDGSDVGKTISNLFNALNTPLKNRSQTSSYTGFPYVNGRIFSENFPEIVFNKRMRAALINAANYDWSTINPTIFGSLFQLIKTKEERGALGEHYTSEENINKIVYPLFLEEFQERLTNAWDSKKQLRELRKELNKIKILDPACGCGNFLVVSYRHLRQIELELIVRLNALEGLDGAIQLDGSMGLSITLNQFYGIEIEEWPAQIARIALFLTEHQENMKLERVTGITPNRFPLDEGANIVQGNALELPWSNLIQISDDTIILGNPPFLGSNWQSESQRMDTANIWGGVAGSSSLDYVANWYLVAARNMKDTDSRCAFVSTSSISRGEQPFVLWGTLNDLGFYINFAHRTFAWDSEAAGKAAVHCVIIGFSRSLKELGKSLWSYATPKSSPDLEIVKNINGYLVDATNILVKPKSKPINSKIQPMRYGNMPNEFGYLANITAEELNDLQKSDDSVALKYIRPVIGAAEMLQNKSRYCLWLVNATPSEIKSSKFISERVKMVRKLRSESKRKATISLAATPHLFQEVREQDSDYLAVPIVSSSSRDYVPMKIFSKEVIPTNALLTIPNVQLEVFTVLQSRVFSLWLQTVGGRLKSDFRISAEIVYNNFPFPQFSEEEKSRLQKAGENLMSVRDKFTDQSLADMYDPNFMPSELRKIHEENDSVVLKAFGIKKGAKDTEILAGLFERFEELSTPKIL
jgi:type I restriction-modification system DNA methylase subunit